MVDGKIIFKIKNILKVYNLDEIGDEVLGCKSEKLYFNVCKKDDKANGMKLLEMSHENPCCLN